MKRNKDAQKLPGTSVYLMRKTSLVLLTSFYCLLVAYSLKVSAIPVYAADSPAKQSITGVTYVFGEKSKYDFATAENSTSTTEDNTYGLFELSGEISSVSTKDGLPSYAVSEGNLQFIYS